MKVDLWSVLKQFFVYKTEHAVFECTVFDSVFSNGTAPWQQFKHAKHGKLVKIVCFFSLRSRYAYNRMNPHEKLQVPAFLTAVYIKTISNTFYTLNSQLFFCQLVFGAIFFENKTQRQRQTNTASVLDGRHMVSAVFFWLRLASKKAKRYSRVFTFAEVCSLFRWVQKRRATTSPTTKLVKIHGLLFISQINLGLRTVGSYNPPIVGAGYWISRYYLLEVPSLSGDEVQVVANISQRGLDLSLAWLPSFAFAPHRVGTLLATEIPWRDSTRFHEGHLSIKFHPLGMKWCSNLFSFQLRSRAFATPCSSSDAPKCIALIGPPRIDHVFVTFRGSSNRQCSATKVVLRLHSLCQEIRPYSSNVLQKQESFRIPSVSGILTVLTVLTVLTN